MKHSVIALTCVSLCAAGQTFARNNISGHLSGIESDTILVQSIQIDNNKNRSLDTIAMKNGKFAFTIDDAAEHDQRKHVEKQMHEASVQEHVGDDLRNVESRRCDVVHGAPLCEPGVDGGNKTHCRPDDYVDDQQILGDRGHVGEYTVHSRVEFIVQISCKISEKIGRGREY